MRRNEPLFANAGRLPHWVPPSTALQLFWDDTNHRLCDREYAQGRVPSREAALAQLACSHPAQSSPAKISTQQSLAPTNAYSEASYSTVRPSWSVGQTPRVGTAGPRTWLKQPAQLISHLPRPSFFQMLSFLSVCIAFTFYPGSFGSAARRHGRLQDGP